jgi:hypothetical protein
MCAQQLRRLIALRKERRCEIKRRECVSIEIKPLDQIAGRTSENCPNPPTLLGTIVQQRRTTGH